MPLTNQIERTLRQFSNLQSQLSNVQTSLFTTQSQMDRVLLEQSLLEKSTLALSQVRPLLSAHTLQQCESLANSAISSVFGLSSTVSWDPESQRFLLNNGEFQVDLAESAGGGLATVVSFVFTVYLLVKLGHRRFLSYDEAFTQVSSEYLPSFISFVSKLCHDLNIDILLVSHDARITIDMVDHMYEIKDGYSIKHK